jgi:hypothetical protein
MKRICLLILSLMFTTSVFSEILTFRCNFTDGQITNFEKGIPSTKREGKFVELIFDQIDKTKQTARLIGNAGAAQIQAIEGDESIHLIEMTMSGNLNITTVFFTEKSKNTGTYPVVHSRHIKIASNPLPSQYVGLCRELPQ